MFSLERRAGSSLLGALSGIWLDGPQKARVGPALRSPTNQTLLPSLVVSGSQNVSPKVSVGVAVGAAVCVIIAVIIVRRRRDSKDLHLSLSLMEGINTQ